MTLQERIKQFAREEGADLVGMAPIEIYDAFLEEVHARIGETKATLEDFMIPAQDAAFFARLSDARATLPSARAVIIVGVYAIDEVAAAAPPPGELRGKIARTYRYYPVVRRVAEKVGARLESLGFEARVGQDVPLKHVAHRIGLGAYGKNALLLTEAYGSYVGLRDIITTAPLEPDTFDRPAPCRDCDRCLRACPTGALYAPYKVNPRLCLNPMTRRDGAIPAAFRAKMQNWVCGCDVCQEVCPANEGLVPRAVDPRAGYDARHHASHRDLEGLDPYPRLIPLLRGAYPERIRRNAAIALENIGEGREEAREALQIWRERGGA